jgi:hypothetical protein
MGLKKVHNQLKIVQIPLKKVHNPRKIVQNPRNPQFKKPAPKPGLALKNYFIPCAAVINASLYTSSSLHPRERSLTGLFNP